MKPQKSLFDQGQAAQDATSAKMFNQMQDISGAGTLPFNPATPRPTPTPLGVNPANPTPTPLGAQEGDQMDTAQQTQLGSTTQVDPATGAAQTIQTTTNS